jgi:hypothetical protein
MKKKKILFASLKSLKKGVGSGTGSISQRDGSADPDLVPHQNVKDPQHCLQNNFIQKILFRW